VNVISVKLSDASGLKGELGVRKLQVGHALLSNNETCIESYGKRTLGFNENNKLSLTPGPLEDQHWIEEEQIPESNRRQRLVTPSAEDKKPSEMLSTEATESLSEKVSRVIKENQGKGLWSTRFLVFKQIYKLILFVALNYVLTLTIFPSLVFVLGIGMSEANGDPLIVLIYNVGDMIGRILYPWSQ
jgi:hypothetical protein